MESYFNSHELISCLTNGLAVSIALR